MFKNIFTNIINLHILYKTNKNINIYTFLKKTLILKNYMNFLNYFIHTQNGLKTKNITTNFFKVSPDVLLTPLNLIIILLVVLEYLWY